MKDVEEDYLKRLKNPGLKTKQLTTAFVSSVTGKKIISAESLGESYWCRNLTSPVLFNTAVTQLLKSNIAPDPVFLEVGPHSALSGPLREIAMQSVGKPIQYASSIVRKQESQEGILRAAGQLFLFNVNIDLSPLCSGAVVHDLPPYAWHRDGRYWSELRTIKNWRLREHPHHDVLGSMITNGNDLEPIWRNIIHLDDVPWIRDHIITDNIVFPGAGYIAIAGEAIRQLTGSVDFSVRNVNITNAMMMKDDRPTEIITQFRPSRVTTTLNSSWYDFAIASVVDGNWTRHCTGQARGGRDFTCSINNPGPGKRTVDSDVWYGAMKKLGLSYGPRFQRLQNLTADVSSKAATASIDNHVGSGESQYTMHPCTVDCIFQLFSVAGFQGVPRLIDHIAVPTFIDELYISPPNGPISVHASAQVTPKGAFFGDSVGFCGSELVFDLKKLRLSVLGDSEDSRGPDPHAGSSLVWKPVIEDVDISTLVRPVRDISCDHRLVEELALTCMIETAYIVKDITPKFSHHAKLRSWLQMQCDKAENGAYQYIPSCKQIAEMSSTSRIQHIGELYQLALQTELHRIATAISRVFENCLGIFEGKVDPLELLMKDDLLASVYDLGHLCDYADFLRLLAHSKPNMNILEIGAGTGGITATILPILRTPNGERTYGSYTYTDISAGFFQAAKERFSDYDGITYRVLDVTSDPLAQGFPSESYDLIIASNVLHATPNLRETLGNVRSLLKPTGKLFLQELYPTTKWSNYVVGILPGWWLGEGDNRPWEPYVSPERWDEDLKATGFAGASSVIHDGNINSHIISSPRRESSSKKKHVTLLHGPRTSTDDHSTSSESIGSFMEYLDNNGFICDTRELGDDIPNDQVIIAMLDLEAPFIHTLTAETFARLKELLLTKLNTCPLLWVTKPSQILCTDPRYSQVLGLARTARRELSVNFTTLEVDRFDKKAWEKCTDIVLDMMDDINDSTFDPITEFAYSSGTVHIGKYYPTVVRKEILEETANDSSKKLQIGKRGLLQTLTWKPRAIVPNGGDWVEIEPRAVGLNFKAGILICFLRAV